MAITLEEIEPEDFDWMLGGSAGRDGLRLPPGGVDDPVVLGIIRRMTERLHAAGCRAAWLIVADREVVGLCSYRRPPQDGCAEIGYGIAESRRRRGYAAHAVDAMCAAAMRGGLSDLIAETAVTNPASSRVLEKNGFVKTGTRHDDEDGEVQMWRKPLGP